MKLEGTIRKLSTRLVSPVSYHLPIGDQQVDMNALIGKELSLSYAGDIHCIHCGRKTKKSFQQGYCYPCFQSLAECDSCLIKPELCHYHLGTCREPAWGEEHCFQDHYVYLSNTSGIKVGITRQTNIPARWIDQGATQALPIFRTRDRLLSGQVEVIFKNHVADKTAWQRMLKGPAEVRDLIAERDRLFAECENEIQALQQQAGGNAVEYLPQASLIDIEYPVLEYPEKVKSFNLDKTPEIAGKLNGIKGQYLLLDSGVINIRKFAGYHIVLQS